MRFQFNKEFFQDISETLFWLSITATVTVYFSLSFFVVPWLEDFLHKKEVMDIGLLKTTVIFYKNWGGRYFSYMLIGASGVFTHSIFNILYWDRTYAIINFLLSIISMVMFVRAASLRQVSLMNAVKYSLLFSAILCMGMPGTFYYLYWSASVVIYTLGISLMLLLFSRLIDLSFSPKKEKNWPVYILIFLLCGTNETVIIATGIFLIAGILLFRIHTGRVPILWVKVLVLLIPFSLVNFLAPGNSARMMDNPMNRVGNNFMDIISLWAAIQYSLINIWSYFHTWIFNFLFIASSILIFISVSVKELSMFKNIKIWHLCLGIFLWLLIIPISSFLPKYYLGFVVARYWNMTYFFFLLGWFSNLSLFKIILLNHGVLKNSFEKIRILLTCMVSVFLLTNMRYIDAANDLFYKAAFMNDFFHDRFKLILASNATMVTVPLFPSDKIPNTIFENLYELRPHPNCFANCAYQGFFGKEVVTEKLQLVKITCYPAECHVMQRVFKTSKGVLT